MLSRSQVREMGKAEEKRWENAKGGREMLNNSAWLDWKVYIWIILGHRLEKVSWGQMFEVSQLEKWCLHTVLITSSCSSPTIYQRWKLGMEITEIDQRIQTEGQLF